MGRTDLIKFIAALLFINFFLFADSFSQTHYIVKLVDKNGSSIEAANAPKYLSAKAINRRLQQRLAFSESDIPVSSSYLNAINAAGFKIVCKSKWLNTVVLVSNSQDIEKNILTLRNLDFTRSVVSAEKRSVAKVAASWEFKGSTVVPSTAALISRSSSSLNYGEGQGQIYMLKGQVIHNAGFTGKGMTIAVLDAGYNNANNFPIFKRIRNSGQILGTWDFVAGDASVYEDDAHGMMVLSTMAGYSPGELIGTAPDADYWLLRSEDATAEYLAEEYFWAQAAEFADSVGADIINSSLGYTVFDNPLENHSYSDLNGNTTPITIAADLAASKGILVVNSAGNEGNGPWNYISAPADGNEVLAVGAVDSLRMYVNFSGNGPTADGRVKPNIAAQGFLAAIASPWDSVIFRGNGTSFSSPIIAGMAACLWQSAPGKTNLEIKEAIERSAHQFNNPDNNLGFGIPDFQLAYARLSGIDEGLLDGDSKIIKVFPNPVDNDFQVIFFSGRDAKHTIRVVDVRGRIVTERSESFCAGLNGLTLNGQSWANGYYQIQISAGTSKSYTYPFIKHEIK